MADHTDHTDHDLRHICGRGFQSRWRCRTCNVDVRGGFKETDDGRRFVVMARGTWP